MVHPRPLRNLCKGAIRLAVEESFPVRAGDFKERGAVFPCKQRHACLCLNPVSVCVTPIVRAIYLLQNGQIPQIIEENIRILPFHGLIDPGSLSPVVLLIRIGIALQIFRIRAGIR